MSFAVLRRGPTLDRGILLMGAIAAIAAGLCIGGVARPDVIAENLHLEVLAIFVALDRFAALFESTGALRALSRKAALATRGDARRSVLLFVGLLLCVGTVNNNLTTAMIALPAVIMSLRAMAASQSTVVRIGAVVLSSGNVAGAMTPTGDFPALVLIASGAIRYPEYVMWGTPLFLITAVIVACVYRRLLRHTRVEAESRLGLALLEAGNRHPDVNKPAIYRLALVFSAMVAAWILLDPVSYPPMVIAWAGYAIAAMAVAPRGVGAVLTNFDLTVVVRLAAILAVGATLTSTGAVDDIARMLTREVHDPALLVLAVMGVTTITSGLVDASAAAAGLLPLVLRLTAAGAPLADLRPITVIAYAAAICAGSSLWTTSATAGQFIERELDEAGLSDPATGERVRFNWGRYVPFGVLNAVTQFVVAAAYVTIVVELH